MFCQCQTLLRRSKRTETRKRASSSVNRIKSSSEKSRISIKMTKRTRNIMTMTMMKGRIMKIGYERKRRATVEWKKEAGRKNKQKLKICRSISLSVTMCISE